MHGSRQLCTPHCPSLTFSYAWARRHAHHEIVETLHSAPLPTLPRNKNPGAETGRAQFANFYFPTNLSRKSSQEKFRIWVLSESRVPGITTSCPESRRSSPHPQARGLRGPDRTHWRYARSTRSYGPTGSKGLSTRTSRPAISDTFRVASVMRRTLALAAISASTVGSDRTAVMRPQASATASSMARI